MGSDDVPDYIRAFRELKEALNRVGEDDRKLAEFKSVGKGFRVIGGGLYGFCDGCHGILGPFTMIPFREDLMAWILAVRCHHCGKPVEVRHG